MSLLPDSIINYIITFITEETPTGILIRNYNNSKHNCYSCKQEIINKICLTCPEPNNHNNCWTCLVKKLKVSDVSCHGCNYMFRCLYDEIQHVQSNE